MNITYNPKFLLFWRRPLGNSYYFLLINCYAFRTVLHLRHRPFPCRFEEVLTISWWSGSIFIIEPLSHAIYPSNVLVFRIIFNHNLENSTNCLLKNLAAIWAWRDCLVIIIKFYHKLYLVHGPTQRGWRIWTIRPYLRQKKKGI